MEEEKKQGILYKVNTDNTYLIHKRDWLDKSFYNIDLTQKQYDGTKIPFSRQLKFVQCEPPQDGDTIKIISGFESDYISPKDKYNPIMTIVVTEYEVVQNKQEAQQEALAEYNQKVNGTDDIIITDDMMPF